MCSIVFVVDYFICVYEDYLTLKLFLPCTMTSLNRPIRLLKTRLINAIQTVRVFRRLINIFAECDNFFGVILMMILKALL